MTERPDFSASMTAPEFLRWYWPKASLMTIARSLGLPAGGSKAELRAAIAHALDPKTPAPEPRKAASKTSGFNWSREMLTLDTVITEDIRFGPNLRRFMTAQIGPRFSCHGDFMEWARTNAGATLRDAVAEWHRLEARKQDPDFRRDIAPHNNYLQYLRDFQDNNPGRTRAEAKRCWDAKKRRPAHNGLVVYEPADLAYLDSERPSEVD